MMDVFIFNVCSLAFPRDFSILDWQDACALFEQFCKPAGGGVSDHLGNLSHGEIGAYEKMLRLTHSSTLNVLRDTAPELPLETAFQLRRAHAGDIRKAFQRKIKGVVIGNVADHI